MKTLRRKVEVKKMHRSLFEPKVELCFLLQDWDDAYNVGGMFRIGDAAGATELVMTGKTPVPPHPQIGVTSLGQHRRLPYRYFKSHLEACDCLKREGWSLIAVEIAGGAQHYMEFEYPEKTCLVLGNEGAGVYSDVMRKCDAAVLIPMAGKGRSLNVHVAAAVVGFQALFGKFSSPPLVFCEDSHNSD